MAKSYTEVIHNDNEQVDDVWIDCGQGICGREVVKSKIQ